MMTRNGDAEMLNLRVGENLVHLVNRPRRHAGRFQLFEPFVRCPRQKYCVEQCHKFGPVAKPIGQRCIVRACGKIGPLQRFAQRAPLAVAADADIDVTVGCLHHAHGR